MKFKSALVLGLLMSACGGGGGTSNNSGPPESVNQAPHSSFTQTCILLNCKFNGTSSSDVDGSIASYSVDFGDGEVGSGANPSHDYSASGDYTVKLTVTDNDGATASSNITIKLSASPRNSKGI